MLKKHRKKARFPNNRCWLDLKVLKMLKIEKKNKKMKKLKLYIVGLNRNNLILKTIGTNQITDPNPNRKIKSQLSRN